MSQPSLELPAVPRTLLGRFWSAILHGDLQRALAVLDAAGQRRAAPRRLLFGPALDRTCQDWPKRRPQRT